MASKIMWQFPITCFGAALCSISGAPMRRTHGARGNSSRRLRRTPRAVAVAVNAPREIAFATPLGFDRFRVVKLAV